MKRSRKIWLLLAALSVFMVFGAPGLTPAKSGTDVHAVTYVPLEEKNFLESPHQTSLQQAEEDIKASRSAGDWSYKVSGGGATLTHYEGKDNSVKVPAKIDGYPVTALGYHLLYEHDHVTSISIPAGVKDIDSLTFDKGSENLTSITVDSGNKTYSSKSGVLFDKKRTALLCYPQGKPDTAYQVPSGVKTIGEFAFSRTRLLQKLTLPDSVEDIESYAFDSSEKLSSVKLGNGVLRIGHSSFRDCVCLKSLHLPKSVQDVSMQNSVFIGCKSLQKLTVDKKNPNYCAADGVLFNKQKTELLYYPSGKKDSSYTIPSSVTTVDFMNTNSHLKKVTMKSGVKTLHEEAFLEDTALKEVTLSSSLTAVSSSAFFACSSLTAVTLPKSVSLIGNDAFYACTSLKKLTVRNADCYFYPFGNTLYAGTVIYGYKGSTAQSYAKGFGHTFVDLNSKKKTTYTVDNATFFKMLPTKDVHFEEQVYQGIQYEGKDGTFGGYQGRIIHESNTKRKEYVELKNFTDNLVKDCPSDYEKMITIAKWVHQNMEYRFGSPSGNQIDSVYAIFKNRIGNCMCYTMLTDYMLFLEGIPTVDIVSATHEWGAAFIDGKWINVDATNDLIGADISSYDSIEAMAFSQNRMSFVATNCEGFYLVSMGYDENDAKKMKEVTIPDFTAGIYESAFFETPSDLIVHGKKSGDVYRFVNQHLLYLTTNGDTFTASAGQPVTTKISSAENTSSGVKLQWSKVNRAKGYEIYRKASGGKWKKCKTISKVSTTTYTDKSAANGKNYSYAVVVLFKSSDGKAFSSAKSSARQLTALTGTKITSVKSGKSGALTVSWKKNAKADGYELQCSLSNKFSSGKTVKKKIKKASSASGTVTKLKKNKKYYVRVRAYKKSGGKTYYSAWSSTKTKTTKK